MPTVRCIAAAAEAAGTNTVVVDAATLGELRDALVEEHGEGFSRVLDRCSILVEGHRTDDRETPLSPTMVVDVLPPFAGG